MPAPSRMLDRIVVRLPDEMRNTLAKVAAGNRRSVNTQVVIFLENALIQIGAWAATGERFGDTTPAAAGNTAACQGRDIINPA